MEYELGIIGAGNMAEAIVRGVQHAGVLTASQIIAADVAAPRRELFQHQLGVTAVEDPRDVARRSRNVLLAVKPQQFQNLGGIGEVMRVDARIISIMAGISTRYIQKHVGGGTTPWRVVRTMPNTPMLVGQGMVAIAPGQHATDEDLAFTRRLFESAATVIELPEDQIDAVTAMSGSGPAYFFYFVEHMIAAGQSIGLSPDHARTLSIQTILGAAKMLATSPDTPQELRRKVTSPGGTTQAAITHLEQHQAGQIFQAAIAAAAKRSKELGV